VTNGLLAAIWLKTLIFFLLFSAMHFLTVTANVNCLLGSFQVIPHPKRFSDGWITWMVIIAYIKISALIMLIDIDKHGHGCNYIIFLSCA
jgi:hypothetical protein